MKSSPGSLVPRPYTPPVLMACTYCKRSKLEVYKAWERGYLQSSSPLYKQLQSGQAKGWCTLRCKALCKFFCTLLRGSGGMPPQEDFRFHFRGIYGTNTVNANDRFGKVRERGCEGLLILPWSNVAAQGTHIKPQKVVPTALLTSCGYK